MVTVRNTGLCNQTINTLDGRVKIAVGQQVDVQLDDAMLVRIGRIDGLSVVVDVPPAQLTASALADAEAEHERLRRELEAIRGTEQPEPEVPPMLLDLEARHKGFGKYSVFSDDGRELVADMTRAQATEFNQMSDVDKNQYVAVAFGNSQES